MLFRRSLLYDEGELGSWVRALIMGLATIRDVFGYLGLRESLPNRVGGTSHKRMTQRSCGVRTMDVRSRTVACEDVVGRAEQ